ncbi:MAG: hypothetical protein AseanaTS_15000 [Candidatus Pelagadaptatus aseana]|uniref:hypothetical protein n=1 Tax=Candidatus Pelagadaptatus aseana TaxID=3120508 RepID=UPI0039B2E504
MRAISKYLDHYAEPECSVLTDFPAHCRYRQCVVIPAYDERPDFLPQLIGDRGLLPSHHGLLILVINRPEHRELPASNLQLMDYLQQQLPTLWHHNTLTLLGNSDWGVLLVDRNHQAIPRKQGVGLARKIGCDLAAQLFHLGQLQTPWVHSTDADAELPDNYLTTDSNKDKTAARLYPYQHKRVSDCPISKATQHYQQRLNYYVEGLRWAGSPYAFHTLGSILAIHIEYYCQARGFPKRAGGEDFYLLNKLAKLGAIQQLPATAHNTITLQPRLSHRVPFGTGPAVEKIITGEGSSLRDYNPQVFACLKQLLDEIGTSQTTGIEPQSLMAQLPSEITSALSDAGIDHLWQHLQQKKPSQHHSHFHLWFDGFRTLKFIHYLQQYHYPALTNPYPQARALTGWTASQPNL